ncbi:hypothetical protein PQX77_006625 [Marasmius sp. AFHP31]|nr:hypothetical protein PQX77_006625 [Marasmius sp. AFHP31]
MDWAYGDVDFDENMDLEWRELDHDGDDGEAPGGDGDGDEENRPERKERIMDIVVGVDVDIEFLFDVTSEDFSQAQEAQPCLSPTSTSSSFGGGLSPSPLPPQRFALQQQLQKQQLPPRLGSVRLPELRMRDIQGCFRYAPPAMPIPILWLVRVQTTCLPIASEMRRHLLHHPLSTHLHHLPSSPSLSSSRETRLLFPYLLRGKRGCRGRRRPTSTPSRPHHLRPHHSSLSSLFDVGGGGLGLALAGYRLRPD